METNQLLKHLLRVCMFLFALGGQAIADSLSDAQRAYDAGNYAKAAGLYRPLAKQGNAEAQFHLGVMYTNGEGVPKNAVKAVEWYRLAAKQGNASAQRLLGFMDYKEAEELHRPTVEQGNAQVSADAVYDKDRVVSQGNGATISEPVSVAQPMDTGGDTVLSEQATANSLSGAQSAYAKGDYTKAAKLYRPLAKQGNAEAQFYLGVMYANGEGMPRDTAKAIEFYRLAAEQGDVLARRLLGVMYDTGQGVPRDYKEAAKWYRLAAEQGGANVQAKPDAAYEKSTMVSQVNTTAVSEPVPVAQPQIASDHPVQPEPTPVAQPPDTSGNTALVRIDRFQIDGNTLLNAELIERLLAPYKGDGRSFTDIQRALEALEGAYRTAGYSAVNVITPEQEVTAGTVTFQVIESKVGKVILSGNQYYDKTNIRNALPALVTGSTPSARDLSDNIRLANENPTRQIEVVLAMGEEENTVDAKVNVQDSSPHKAFVTMDNTGNASTGMYRIGVGYQHNNLFNRDHALTLNYTTSPDHISSVTQLSASYRLPIYTVGDSIDLLAAYSNTNAGTTSVGGSGGPLLTFSGKGNVYGAHYNHYLPRRGDYTSKIIGGLDYRAAINNCLLAGTACPGTPDLNVLPLTITYGGTLTKPTSVADFSTALVRNLPGGSKGGTDVFIATRHSPTDPLIGAPANYTILRLDGSLAGALPQNWQYRLAGNAQYTNDALIPAEKLGLVGANTVRGFLEREFSNDRGYVLNVEIYTPDLASRLNIKDGSFRLLGFVDNASGWDKLLPGELANRTSVGSVGVGFRYTHGKNITTKFDLARVACGDTDGKKCTDTSILSRTGDLRGHIGLVATF